MILTPLALDDLDTLLDRYQSTLPPSGVCRDVFDRVSRSRSALSADPGRLHAAAVALADRFGMQPLPEPPQAAFSWDGARVRTLSEAAVLIHEVAHFQLASPARRFLPDFGLGAGPETGRAAEADAARRVPDPAREAEEQMASLLGILWELELGQPAILAFMEQNWLEGAGRPGTTEFFRGTLARLIELGMVGEDGRPLDTLRIAADP